MLSCRHAAALRAKLILVLPLTSPYRQLRKAAEEKKAEAEGKGGGGDRWAHDRFGQEDVSDDDEPRVGHSVGF